METKTTAKRTRNLIKLRGTSARFIQTKVGRHMYMNSHTYIGIEDIYKHTYKYSYVRVHTIYETFRNGSQIFQRITKGLRETTSTATTIHSTSYGYTDNNKVSNSHKCKTYDQHGNFIINNIWTLLSWTTWSSSWATSEKELSSVAVLLCKAFRNLMTIIMMFVWSRTAADDDDEMFTFPFTFLHKHKNIHIYMPHSSYPLTRCEIHSLPMSPTTGSRVTALKTNWKWLRPAGCSCVWSTKGKSCETIPVAPLQLIVVTLLCCPAVILHRIVVVLDFL